MSFFQIQQIKQLIAAKKLLDVSMYSEKLTNVIEV